MLTISPSIVRMRPISGEVNVIEGPARSDGMPGSVQIQQPAVAVLGGRVYYGRIIHYSIDRIEIPMFSAPRNMIHPARITYTMAVESFAWMFEQMVGWQVGPDYMARRLR